jgi:hypothetical protein
MSWVSDALIKSGRLSTTATRKIANTIGECAVTGMWSSTDRTQRQLRSALYMITCPIGTLHDDNSDSVKKKKTRKKSGQCFAWTFHTYLTTDIAYTFSVHFTFKPYGRHGEWVHGRSAPYPSHTKLRIRIFFTVDRHSTR